MMAGNSGSLAQRIRAALRRGSRKSAHDKRHPVRNSYEYEEIKHEAVEALDALYARIVSDIKDDIADIDTTVGDIAEPMADKLAKGAVADVFEAAAEELKKEIREARESDDARQDPEKDRS